LGSAAMLSLPFAPPTGAAAAEEELWVPAAEDEAAGDDVLLLEPPQAARPTATAAVAAVSESFEIMVLLYGRRRIRFSSRFCVVQTSPAAGPSRRRASCTRS